jgi:Ca2+-binding EF-hand superfamily protein
MCAGAQSRLSLTGETVMKTLLAVSSMALTMVLICSGQESVTRALPANKDTSHGRKCPADKITVGGHDVVAILELLGAKRETGATDRELLAYTKPFNRLDANGDGKHSKKEYIVNGVHMNPQARRGIFKAADNNGDGFVTRTEYVLNRVITDEAKGIVQATDADKNGKVTRAEFIDGSPLKDKLLAAAVFDSFDSNRDNTISIPEYLRVWGGWARPDYKKQEAEILARLQNLKDSDSVSINQ